MFKGIHSLPIHSISGISSSQNQSGYENLSEEDISNIFSVEDTLNQMDQANANALWEGSPIASSSPFANIAQDNNAISKQAEPQPLLDGAFGNQVQDYNDVNDFLNEVTATSNQNSQAAADLGSDLSFSSFAQAIEGIEALYAMQLQNTQQSTALDNETLDKKRAGTNVAEFYEEFTYAETVQEKLTNIDRDFKNTQMQNRFSLSKTAANAARYS